MTRYRLEPLRMCDAAAVASHMFGGCVTLVWRHAGEAG